MRLHALAVLLLLATATFAAERPRRAAWVWNNAVVDEAAQREAFLRFCAQRKLTAIFLHAPAEHLRERAVGFRALLRDAHRRGLRVEALDGHPRWAWERAEAEEFLAAVQTFNAAGAPDERFDGLHLDVEPYDTPEWKQDPQRVAAELLELLDVLRSQQGALTLTADVPPWYGEFRLAEGTLLSGVIARVDAVALMAYTNQARGLAAEVMPALEFAAARGKGVWVGVSAQLYDSDMDPARPLRPQVERVLKQAERRFRRAPALRGVALHDFEHLRALYDKR